MQRLLLVALLLAVPMIAAESGKKSNAPAAAPSGKGATATLDECVKPFDPAREEKTASGWAHWFVAKKQSGGLNLKMSYVDQGTSTHAAHQHPEDEIFYILEGNAVVELNGATRQIGPGTAFYCPSGSMHGIRRAGAEPIKYLVIKPF